MMTRRVSIVVWAILTVSACSDSTGTAPSPAADQDDSGPLMAALLAWQHKNLPMHVTDVQADAAGGGRTVSAQLRNESDVVACNGGWDTGDTSPLLLFPADLRPAVGGLVWHRWRRMLQLPAFDALSKTRDSLYTRCRSRTR